MRDPQVARTCCHERLLVARGNTPEEPSRRWCHTSNPGGDAPVAATWYGPPGSRFGHVAVVLPNDNVVISDPAYDLPDGTADAGAGLSLQSPGRVDQRALGLRGRCDDPGATDWEVTPQHAAIGETAGSGATTKC